MRINDELVLDAGTCEEVSGPHGGERFIHPPETTLYHQVLAYLLAKPDPPKRPSGSMVGREGVAAATLVLRWGSYLVVLLDHDKPIWSEVTPPSTSRISDEEIARINIEAAAALAVEGDVGNYCNASHATSRRAGARLPIPATPKDSGLLQRGGGEPRSPRGS